MRWAVAPKPNSHNASVSPNPAKEEAAISFKAPVDATAILRIFDLNGRPVAEVATRKVYNGEDVRMPFSTANVRPGVYQYRLFLGDHVSSGRLIVQ